MKKKLIFNGVGVSENEGGVSNFEDCRGRFDNRKLCLSPYEVSEAIGLNIMTVRKLIRSGVIPSVHCGNRYIVPVSALEEALADLVGKELSI